MRSVPGVGRAAVERASSSSSQARSSTGGRSPTAFCRPRTGPGTSACPVVRFHSPTCRSSAHPTRRCGVRRMQIVSPPGTWLVTGTTDSERAARRCVRSRHPRRHPSERRGALAHRNADAVKASAFRSRAQPRVLAAPPQSAATGLPRATPHRLLESPGAERLADRDPASGRSFLGPETYRAGRGCRRPLPPHRRGAQERPPTGEGDRRAPSSRSGAAWLPRAWIGVQPRLRNPRTSNSVHAPEVV
jgi:hypothetical protein